MNGREVLIGISGGVAAFKSAILVSRLVQAGNRVTVVMTEAAEAFIGAATFAALTGRPVVRDLFDPAYPLGAHIELAERAEVFCVAPATANFLAKAAQGHADDLLTTLSLSFTGQMLVAPAMNHQMWNKASVQRNVARLREDGFTIIEPTSGWLSCRQEGQGRMAEPEVIVEKIQSCLAS